MFIENRVFRLILAAVMGASLFYVCTNVPLLAMWVPLTIWFVCGFSALAHFWPHEFYWRKQGRGAPLADRDPLGFSPK